jgi:hypothetical protein
LDIETHRNHHSSSRDGRETLAAAPRRPKTVAVSVFGGNEFDTMVLEEMGRLVSIREGETIEKTSLMRAATRAIGLKAAKGDVKAYTAVSAKFAAVENRRRAQQEELLRAVTEYKQRATQELTPRPRRAFECPVGLGPI